MSRTKQELKELMAQVSASLTDIREEEKELTAHLAPKKRDLHRLQNSLKRELAEADAKGWAVAIRFIEGQVEYVETLAVSTHMIGALGVHLMVDRNGKLVMRGWSYDDGDILHRIELGTTASIVIQNKDPSEEVLVFYHASKEEAVKCASFIHLADPHPKTSAIC